MEVVMVVVVVVRERREGKQGVAYKEQNTVNQSRHSATSPRTPRHYTGFSFALRLSLLKAHGSFSWSVGNVGRGRFQMVRRIKRMVMIRIEADWPLLEHCNSTECTEYADCNCAIGIS